jgi:acyl-CoA synthetase (AMP-forming)/AMP-acid ligase II
MFDVLHGRARKRVGEPHPQRRRVGQGPWDGLITLGELPGLRAAEEPDGPDPPEGRLHRRRGHRPGDFPLLPVARAEPETALRPDGSQRLHHRMQPDGEIYGDTVGKPATDVELKIAENGEVLYRSPGVFVGYYKNNEATKSTTKTEDGWVHDRRRRLHRRQRPSQDHRPGQGRRQAERAARCSRRNTSRTS